MGSELSCDVVCGDFARKRRVGVRACRGSRLVGGRQHVGAICDSGSRFVHHMGFSLGRPTWESNNPKLPRTKKSVCL